MGDQVDAEGQTAEAQRLRRIAIACAALGWLGLVAWAPASVADEAASSDAPGQSVGDAGEGAADGYLTSGYWEGVWNRNRLTGDWAGLRTDLEDHGVKPRVRFSQFLQGVTTGGLDQNGRCGGKMDWILDVDVSKLAGIWPGLMINLHSETRYGKSVITAIWLISTRPDQLRRRASSHSERSSSETALLTAS